MQAPIKLAVLCAIFPVILADLKQIQRRITNGVDAFSGQFPFVVLIKGPSWDAAGSIINKRYILVGSVPLKDANASELTVIAGTNDVDGTDGVVYQVEDTIPHPGLVPNTFITDGIGLLRVHRDIEYTRAVQPIRLACERETCIGCLATVVGWGRQLDNKSRKLQVAHVHFVSNNECVKSWSNFQWVKPQRFVCTSKRTRSGLCCGDSGAPVVAFGRLVGVGAFSTTLSTTDYPDVYMRVSYYKNWIINHSKLSGDENIHQGTAESKILRNS